MRLGTFHSFFHMILSAQQQQSAPPVIPPDTDICKITAERVTHGRANSKVVLLPPPSAPAAAAALRDRSSIGLNKGKRGQADAAPPFNRGWEGRVGVKRRRGWTLS